jgi:hypothetical protein
MPKTKKPRRDGLSLYPMKFEDAVKLALATPLPPEERRKKRKKMT